MNNKIMLVVVSVLFVVALGFAVFFGIKANVPVVVVEEDNLALELEELQEKYDELEESYNRIPSGEVSYKNSVINQFMDDFLGYKFIIRIPTDKYLYYKGLEHPLEDRSDYLRYVTYGDDKVKELAKQVRSYLPKGYSALDYADALHLFIHKYPHEEDIDNYPKYAIETIAEGSGDCEDLAILLASLMKAGGFDTVLLVYHDRHMGVGAVIDGASGSHYVYDGKKYYYMEATGTTWPDEPTGWPVGEMPSKYKDDEVEIYEV